MNRWFIMILLTLIFPFPARADQEGFTPYTMVSADGKYVFVMIYDKRKYTDDTQLAPYPQNGLYLNDGSKAPLWTVDWIAYAFLPSDGVHLVRSGGWAHREDGYEGEAISFLASGRVLKTYRVRDLVDFPSLLPHSSSHYEWRAAGWTLSSQPGAPVMMPFPHDDQRYYQLGVGFDEVAHTMTLRTLHGDNFVFDLNTGQILFQRRPVRMVLFALLVVFLSIYGAYLWRAARGPLNPLRKSIVLTVGIALWISTLMLLAALASMLYVPQSLTRNVFFNAFEQFVWTWPVRFGERPAGDWILSYPHREAQTLVIWTITFAGLGILNNRLVWTLRTWRQRRAALADESG